MNIRHSSILTAFLLLCVMSFLLNSSCSAVTPREEFRSRLADATGKVPMPVYYDKFTGEKPHAVNVTRVGIQFDTSTGKVYGEVYGGFDYGFWNVFSMHYTSVWLCLYFDDTKYITPEMLEHPDKFYWVVYSNP